MKMSDASESTGWDNSTLAHRIDLDVDLTVFRIRPDSGLFPFLSGQYTVIGMPCRAPRCEGADPDETPGADPDKLIRRAYSIASSSKQRDYVELYITLVRSGALTPRLWTLEPGDRLWLGPKAKGHFTVDVVPSERNLVLVGTGTGLAPYISMIKDHHTCNMGRRFVVVHGARYVRELGYRDELEALDHDCHTLAYLPTVTRPDDRDDWHGHVGRVQSVFSDGAVEAALGGPLSPESTHVFLAGHPEMVEDMQQMLTKRGYTLHSARSPGSLHVERYW